jgi:hypothetical protein
MQRLSDTQMFDKLTKSKCYIDTVNQADKNKVNKARQGTNPTTPSSLIAQVAAELGLRAHKTDAPPPPPPPPPPPAKRYAPRTHNLGGHDQDPRFCMKPEYGVTIIDHPTYGRCYQDEMGCCYDIEHGLNLDGLRDRNFMVAGLKGADSMDGAEPCDPYTANGISVPPYPGDPYAQTGSYHR